MEWPLHFATWAGSIPPTGCARISLDRHWASVKGPSSDLGLSHPKQHGEKVRQSELYKKLYSNEIWLSKDQVVRHLKAYKKATRPS